jgi:hypothetical protein
MLPFSLGGALVSACSGQVVARIKAYRPVIWFAWPVMTLGFGLMIGLGDKSGPCVFSFRLHLISCRYAPVSAREAVFPLITALGTGCLCACLFLLW